MKGQRKNPPARPASAETAHFLRHLAQPAAESDTAPSSPPLAESAPAPEKFSATTIKPNPPIKVYVTVNRS